MRGGGVCWDMSSTCVQSGTLVHPMGGGGGYQQMIMEPHSPVSAWQTHPQIPPILKQEKMDEDLIRHDSGINSASSDFQSSSSPGSENSQDSPSVSTVVSNQNNSIYPMNCTTSSCNPFYTTSSAMYPNVNLMEHYQQQQQQQLRNEESHQKSTEDALQKLQMSLEKAGFAAPILLSPKAATSMSENSDDGKSDGETDEYDEQGIRIPRVNSHGKIKTFKCKQCDFVAVTKLEFWEHSKAHIKADKLLTCPKCPFVTEYKHHLEYHLRNHFGSKPFKCDKCSYSCVNKSMLNSHMKSHSNVYQYRCSDCSYATKYCHSLKLHLRKYSHKPAMVLNPDGTPNPLPIIDVYGTRRGPKQKSYEGEIANNPATKLLHNHLAQFVMNASGIQIPFPYPFLGGFPNPLTNPLLFNQPETNNGNINCTNTDNDEEVGKETDGIRDEDEEEEEDEEEKEDTLLLRQDDSGALDLTKHLSAEPTKNRRKGRAYKIDKMMEDDDNYENADEDSLSLQIDEKEEEEEEQQQQHQRRRRRQQEEEEEEEQQQQQHQRRRRQQQEEEEKEEEKKKSEEQEIEVEKAENNNKADNFACQFCNIAFGDIVLYTMHMGYHGYKNPFTCNMCGEECNDKVSFFLHIARNPHT